jgi:pimeloyl-ACP methyl ester carboxylesterase
VQPIGSLTICGHSLGGALATLLALDLAANTKVPAFRSPVVYTYASPRTGDSTFANTYDHVVPNTFRFANRIDIVPKLPLPPMYKHVARLIDLNPVILGLPPTVLVNLTIPCQHALSTYIYLLSLLPGATLKPKPLDWGCAPT